MTTVGDLIKALSDYCPDTPVRVVPYHRNIEAHDIRGQFDLDPVPEYGEDVMKFLDLGADDDEIDPATLYFAAAPVE